MQSVGEVSEVILISKLKPGFSVSHVKTQSQNIQNYELIQLFWRLVLVCKGKSS
ncbi:hypothetical protein FORC9_1290 [Vibrio vulnificus]|nr:hypothetical protein FORC9_1290 [Vibrio vulnificus]ANH63386.1 hypothetical protein FORC16_1503 [Vibrio vulnificus]